MPVDSGRLREPRLSTLPEPVKSDILDLPPMDTWVNIRSLGAKGDGAADDTEAIRKAIAEHTRDLLAVWPISSDGHDLR